MTTRKKPTKIKVGDWVMAGGHACEFAIARCVPDWEKWVRDHFESHRADIAAILATKRDGFVERKWLGREHMDGGGTPQMGWGFSDDPTGFPVFIFDPVYKKTETLT